MAQKRLKVALVVLDAVKSTFPETKEFIDDTLKEECEKEKTTADEVIFFTSLEAKNQLGKTFLFQICTTVIIFCLQVWKDAEDSKKTKWLSKEEINKQLLGSIIINEVVESEELNKKAEEIQESEEEAEVIKQYE